MWAEVAGFGVAGGRVWVAAYSGGARNPRNLSIFKESPHFKKQFGVKENWAGFCPRGCQMSPSASSVPDEHLDLHRAKCQGSLPVPSFPLRLWDGNVLKAGVLSVLLTPVSPGPRPVPGTK